MTHTTIWELKLINKKKPILNKIMEIWLSQLWIYSKKIKKKPILNLIIAKLLTQPSVS